MVRALLQQSQNVFKNNDCYNISPHNRLLKGIEMKRARLSRSLSLSLSLTHSPSRCQSVSFTHSRNIILYTGFYLTIGQK